MPSKNGLITTAGYRIRNADTVYALEGSIAITGALVQWLRDNLKMIKAAPEIEDLAKTRGHGGVYFVPASRVLLPLPAQQRAGSSPASRATSPRGTCRAVLEATAYQSREVVEAMNADSGVDLESLKVDGGMVANDLLMSSSRTSSTLMLSGPPWPRPPRSGPPTPRAWRSTWA